MNILILIMNIYDKVFCMVVVKIVENGFFGLEGISDGVFVGIEVCSYFKYILKLFLILFRKCIKVFVLFSFFIF